MAGDRTFCCAGCQAVHDLLRQSGLEHFYALGEHPGTPARAASGRERWAFLDDPAVQPRLLDFTDGRLSKVTFHLPSIHCVACVWLLENLFRLNPGIGGSQVDFSRREVVIRFAPERIQLSELVALLAAIGYEPSLTLGELEPKPRASRTRRRQWLQIGIAGFAFGNIMLISLPLYVGLDSFSGPLFRAAFGGLSLALALPVVVYSASDYWRTALLSLRQKVLTLDVPITLGLAALYARSAWEILAGRGPGYLDSLTGLVFLLLCGRAFQQKTHDRLAFDRDFKSFFPLSVTRLRPNAPGAAGLAPRPAAGAETGAANGREERVALSRLAVGDRLLIRNGELVPADSKLVGGPALLDYSFVTGESEPAAKAAGAYLYAGGQQRGGAIEVEIVKPVSQSYLTSLWNHAAFQKRREDSLNTLTNRFSRRFTLIVVGVALAAAAGWLATGDAPRAVKAFTSVLIVACPCALALAAPFTLGTAQRLLGRLNVFLKNAQVIERMAQVDTVVFDKTGTLTAARSGGVTFHLCGGPSGKDVREELMGGSAPAPSYSVLEAETSGRRRSQADLWLGDGGADGEGKPLTPAERGWVRSLARHSTHPHAVRIGAALGGPDAPEPVAAFRETPGCGVEGIVQGHALRLGSLRWLQSCGVAVPPNGLPSGSVVGLAVAGTFRGAFVLANALRPQTDDLLHRLAARYEIALLSGDNEKERERFRGLFGGDARLHFHQSPLDKLDFIRRLQASGRTVMMVGDGLNDAGALQQSDVGVAVVEHAGAFSPASDLIVAARQVPRLNEVLALARRAALIVRLSFGLSALYNVLGVGIAAAGVLSPLICAVLMPLSSISVVLFAVGATTFAARRSGLWFDLNQTSSAATACPGSPTSNT